jgi:hypothetical protein
VKYVIQRDGVVVTDCNASSSYARFADGKKGLEIVDRERVYATYWTHQNPMEQLRRKSIKCAEVLVPDRIDTTLVRGIRILQRKQGGCRSGAAVVARQGLRESILPVMLW